MSNWSQQIRQQNNDMFHGPSLEVIKLEFILRLKIKRNDWLLADTPIIAIYFEFETVLKFNNIEA